MTVGNGPTAWGTNAELEIDGGVVRTIYLEVSSRGTVVVRGGALYAFGLNTAYDAGIPLGTVIDIAGSGATIITHRPASTPSFTLVSGATLKVGIDTGGTSTIQANAAVVNGTVDVYLLPATPEPTTGTVYTLVNANSSLTGTPALDAADEPDWDLAVVGNQLQLTFTKVVCDCETVTSAALQSLCTTFTTTPPTSSVAAEAAVVDAIGQAMSGAGCPPTDPCGQTILDLFGL